MIRLWVLLTLWASMTVAEQGSLFTASVNKTTIALGESITLTLTLHEKPRAEPDLSVLERDFTIVSRHVSQETSMVNGSFSAKVHYVLEIFPKSEEHKLVIPSIRLGKYKTEAITITQSQEAKPSVDGVSLVVTTDRKHVYVNAELIVRIELKSMYPIRSGSLTDLEVKDAIIEKLDVNETKETVSSGIKHYIIERAYALYPTKAGTITIPSLMFNGVAPAMGQHRFGWSDFFSRGSRISARSKEVSVEVLDIPKEYPENEPFLPVKSLFITETIEKSANHLEVNRAYTRHFEVKAKGTLAAYLPNLKKPDVANLSIQVEDSNKTQKNLADGIEASRVISHIYMPKAPGTLVVPKQAIYWWDVDNNKLEMTPIREFTMEVLGAAASDEALNNPAVDKAQEHPVEKPAQEPDKLPIFMAMMVVFIGLVVLVVVYFLLRKKKLKTEKNNQITLSTIRQNLLTACQKQDAHGVFINLTALQNYSLMHPDHFIFGETWQRLLKTAEALVFAGIKNDASAIFVELPKALAIKKPLGEDKPVLAPLYPL